MNLFKIIGLSAFTVLALMALGVSSASATELYSTGVTVNAGTKLVISQESETTSLLSTTDGKTLVDTCTESGLEGVVDAYTGGDVTITISSLTWGGCSRTTDTLTTGSFRINSEGAVSGSGSVVTMINSVTCRYGTGAGTAMGTAAEGKLSINTIVNEQEPKAFLCPDTTKWTAKYVVTSPHELTLM